MITVSESGMMFQFHKEQVYVIEDSKLHKSLGNGIKTVEFIVSLKENELAFVEAKSSSPQPTKENKEKFDIFIQDIAEKFVHSFNMFMAATMNRQHDEAIVNSLLEINNEKAHYKFILIIKGHNIEWLPPLNDALEKQLLYHQKIWKTSIILMNEDLAKEYRLVKA